MPRTIIPVVDFSRAGIALGAAGTEVTGDTTNQHYIENDGRIVVIARNSAGNGTRNVTVLIAQNSIDGQTVSDPARAVPINSSKVLGPYPLAIYGQQADGHRLYLNVDSSELKLQAFRLPL